MLVYKLVKKQENRCTNNTRMNFQKLLGYVFLLFNQYNLTLFSIKIQLPSFHPRPFDYNSTSLKLLGQFLQINYGLIKLRYGVIHYIETKCAGRTYRNRDKLRMREMNILQSSVISHVVKFYKQGKLIGSISIFKSVFVRRENTNKLKKLQILLRPEKDVT